MPIVAASARPARIVPEDALAAISALLPVLNYTQIMALKAQIDSATTTASSRLLELPLEIRLLIYTQLFHHIDDIITIKRVKDPEDDDKVTVTGLHECTNILLVSRQITQEAQPVLRKAIESRKLRFCMAPYRSFSRIREIFHDTSALLAQVKEIQLPFSGLPGMSIRSPTAELRGKTVVLMCAFVASDKSVMQAEHTHLKTRIGTSTKNRTQLKDLVQSCLRTRFFRMRTHRFLSEVGTAFGSSNCRSLKVVILVQSRGAMGTAYHRTVYEMAMTFTFTGELPDKKNVEVKLSEVSALKGRCEYTPEGDNIWEQPLWQRLDRINQDHPTDTTLTDADDATDTSDVSHDSDISYDSELSV